MTLKQLRDTVSTMPVDTNRFGAVDHFVAWLDWAMIPDRGEDSEAPWLIWDDDGMIMIQDGEQLSIIFGCRREGKWFAVRAPQERLRVEG